MEFVLVLTVLSFVVSLPLAIVLKSNADKKRKAEIRKIVLEVLHEERLARSRQAKE